MLSFELKYVYVRGEYIVCTLIQYVLEYLQKQIIYIVYVYITVSYINIRTIDSVYEPNISKHL